MSDSASFVPLNIALMAHSLYPIAEPYAGGLEMITHALADALVEKGHQVILYAHPDSQTQAQLVPFLSQSELESRLYPNEHESLGMTQVECHQYLRYQHAMSDAVARVQQNKLDVVHNHSLHHVPILTGQGLGKRMITTFHTPIFAHLRLALLALPKTVAMQFTSVSQFQQQLYAQFVPSQVIYNGINTNTFKPNLTPNTQQQYFWYGRICPEKGTHLAINYCMQAGKKLRVAGPISNVDYHQQYVAPLLAADAGEYISYVGHLSQEAIQAELRRATAMLFTSTWDEPYGLTLAESLACGTPVVAFDVGAASEILTPLVGVVVAKEDGESFKAALDQVAELSRQDCRLRAESFCSVATMVDAYEALYYDAISQAIGRPVCQSNSKVAVMP